MSRGKLPAKYRLARNIDEGYEVQSNDGDWLLIEHALHIVAPLPISSFRYADGSRSSHHPEDRIMSRRPAPITGGTS